MNKENFAQLGDYYALADKGATSPFAAMESIFSGVSLNEIKARINDFNKNTHKLNYFNAREKIKQVIMVNHKSTQASTYSLENRTMLPGSIFWRARVVDDFKPVLEESEFWAPKDCFVKKYGRVNHIGQSVLYTSLHPSTTAFEVRSKAGSKIISISYEVIDSLDVMWVENDFQNIGYSENTFKKIEKINKFISKNLRKIGNEAYIFSATFANHFLPHDSCGWVFKSTLDRSGWNYCFRPDKISKKLFLLKIYAYECHQDGSLGKMVGTYVKSDDGTYRYCEDANFLANDWSKFTSEKNGNCSSGDMTTLFEKNSPYTAKIITV